MVINISEAQFNKLFHTRQDSFLNENRESKNMKMARNVVREMNPSADPQEVITAIRNDIPNTRMLDCKFLPGVTRMYLNGEIQQGSQIQQLNKTLELLATAHGDEYNQDLNGMSCDELIERFSKAASEQHEKEKSELDSMNFTINNDYEIVRIDSFEEAHKYKKYTSWCVCGAEENYDRYTNGGSGIFYFCLKKGFQKVPKKIGEGTPLDEYGLSMIATSVNEDGTCNTITCRWNHDNGGNDHIMTPKELSQIIGTNYFQVFKPYTSEELMEKGIIPFAKVQEILDNGTDPNELFEVIGNLYDNNNNPTSIQWVSFKNKRNLLYDGRLLSKRWYDYIGNFSNSYVTVKINGKWNFLNLKSGELLCSTWFDSITVFGDNEHAFVFIEGLGCNLIKKDGSFVFDKWMKYIKCLHPTVDSVCWQLETYDYKYNYMFDKQMELVFKDWLSSKTDTIFPFRITFRNGNEIFAFAQIPEPDLEFPINEWNFFDNNGNLMKSINTNDIKYTSLVTE